ncbi:MAG: arylsulfatase [Acidobacteria bacterium]|nr:arylsulfatase [Acidobacteriota bacterium]
MDRFSFSRRELLTAATGLLSNTLGAAGQPKPPNIVVILADDQGWGDLSIHGNSNLSTPHIDSLARDGALFDRFYVCAVCAPTRAEFLTGRYHARGGVRGVSTGAERLNLDEKTIAQTFKPAGYATGAFGKWHNGSQFPYHPNARGFDEYYGFTSGHWGQYFDPELDHNGKLVRGKGYITDDLTNHAMEFIAQHKDRPFFCYLPFNTPHAPMQVPDRFFERFANFDPKMRARDPRQEEIPMTRAALAMCENIDWNVGRVLAKLGELKLANDTIVLYFSDNGPNSWRWNGGMKGRKGSVDEGGLRVPFLIRWPGRIRPGVRVSQIAGAIDLLPTLADLAGIPLASAKPLDGKSVKPLLMEQAKEWPDRMIFSLQAKRISVRTQQYRLDANGQLFDMLGDPGQERDVAKENPGVAAKLRQAVAQWAKEVLPLVGADDRPFPVGYSKTTLLPARDGVSEGGIERSAKPPNCSFFTNWTSKDDRMSWDIEVAHSGEYDADVYYTCAPGNTGSTVELSFLDGRVRRKIAEAHDPPLVGEKDDRVPRGESYVKDFRPLRLGAIPLPKGRGKLTLRALEIAGKQVADVRYVALTLRN